MLRALQNIHLLFEINHLNSQNYISIIQIKLIICLFVFACGNYQMVHTLINLSETTTTKHAITVTVLLCCEHMSVCYLNELAEKSRTSAICYDKTSEYAHHHPQM